MKFAAQWSIRRRLVALILSIAILTVATVGVIALSANATTLRQQTQFAYVNNNQALANALDTQLQEVAATTRLRSGSGGSTRLVINTGGADRQQPADPARAADSPPVCVHVRR
jgi:hypothetical protein